MTKVEPRRASTEQRNNGTIKLHALAVAISLVYGEKFSQKKQEQVLNFKTPYAIFYALKKLKYLLHDKSFIIRTDSKNLSYMNAENKSQKVQRWKLHCQEFDFKVEHINRNKAQN